MIRKVNMGYKTEIPVSFVIGEPMFPEDIKSSRMEVSLR